MKKLLAMMLAVLMAFGVFGASAAALASPAAALAAEFDVSRFDPLMSNAEMIQEIAEFVYAEALDDLSVVPTAFMPGRNRMGWNAAMNDVTTMQQMIAQAELFFVPHARLYAYQIARIWFVQYLILADGLMGLGLNIRNHGDLINAIDNAVIRAWPSQAAAQRMASAGQWAEISVYIDRSIVAMNNVLSNNRVNLPAFPFERPSVPASAVRIAGASARDMVAGNTLNLNATASPAAMITWTTSNRNVATVNASGRVTAVGPGTATITARTPCGNRATVRINVANTILSTRHEATVANWLLFFFGFGWLWMWF